MRTLPQFDGVITNARIVTPTRVIDRGRLVARSGIITEVQELDPGEQNDQGGIDASGAYLFPGFVDLHCHGGGGASFMSPKIEEIDAAIEFHRSHGTTTLLASTVSAAHETLVQSCRTLAPVVASGRLAGIHLEGPYLAATRCGAQNPSHLRAPSIDELDELRVVSNDTIRQVTIAPELPGALTTIEWLVSHGIVAAIGHTDATADVTTQAIDRGATLATHVCNAMPPLHHRDPTATSALIDDDRVTLELINDHVHVHPSMIRLLAARGGRHRVVFVTDAIAAAGQPDGEYQLGGLDIIVTNGVARLENHTETLAGSTLTMARAARNALQAGFDPVDVGHMTATTPARTLGLTDRGTIELGKRADLVLLTP